MAYLRLLGHHFDPVHIKPGNISRTASLLYARPPQQTQRELKTSGFPAASETVVAVSIADASNILPCWIPAVRMPAAKNHVGTSWKIVTGAMTQAPRL